MIAVEGVVVPAGSEGVTLDVLKQAFRRSYESVEFGREQWILRLDRFRVLLETEPRRLCVGVVVNFPAEAQAFHDRFASELDRWAAPGTLRTSWSENRQVPVALR
ncbi:MAG TPA: hypothetical protein VIL55_15600 [Naasia sp.]|jgi:hypothetical protein